MSSKKDKPEPEPIKMHARSQWCPNGCSLLKDREPEQLVERIVSKTHKQKRCRFCKLKVRFIRTDTPEGRALRQKQWYEANIVPTLVKPKGVVLPKSPAQRMREFRLRQREEAAKLLNDEADGMMAE